MDVGPTSTASLLDLSFHNHHQSTQSNGAIRRLNSYPTQRKATKLPPLLSTGTKEDSNRTSSGAGQRSVLIVEDSTVSRLAVGESKVDEEEGAEGEAKGSNCDSNCEDCHQRIKQMERNLKFVKDHNQMILNCLHNEIDDLKRRNKELQFQIVMGFPPGNSAQNVTKIQSLISMPLVKAALPREVRDHIESLEREVTRLRYALGETLKMNANLRSQLMIVKGQGGGGVDNNNSKQKGEPDDHLLHHSDRGGKSFSPQFDDYQKTLKEITSLKPSFFAANASNKRNSTHLPRIK